MNDLFGQSIDERTVPVQSKTPRPNGYARRPGSGPEGMTCGDCAYCYRLGHNTKHYHKCEIIRHRWTHGPGTDILKRSPACEMFVWKNLKQIPV